MHLGLFRKSSRDTKWAQRTKSQKTRACQWPWASPWWLHRHSHKANPTSDVRQVRLILFGDYLRGSCNNYVHFASRPYNKELFLLTAWQRKHADACIITWAMGSRFVILSGNYALVTRNVDILRLCSSFTNVLISGYIIGSPTSESAQCLGFMPSAKRSGLTPTQHSNDY
jgi:hypothetical protein